MTSKALFVNIYSEIHIKYIREQFMHELYISSQCLQIVQYKQKSNDVSIHLQLFTLYDLFRHLRETMTVESMLNPTRLLARAIS